MCSALAGPAQRLDPPDGATGATAAPGQESAGEPTAAPGLRPDNDDGVGPRAVPGQHRRDARLMLRTPSRAAGGHRPLHRLDAPLIPNAQCAHATREVRDVCNYLVR